MGVRVLAAFLLLAITAGLAVRTARRGRPEKNHRWVGRPFLGGVLVGLAYSTPIVAAVVTSAVLSRQFRYPHGWVAWVTTWGMLLGASTVVLVVTERLCRRILPLAALLKLPMVFPGPAPARMVVAARAGSTRRLQERLDHARAHGVSDEPTVAAAQILSLVGALHAHDRRTRGHAERVRTLTELLADEMRLDPDSRDKLRWASLLHDIGKLEVSKRILNKPGALKPKEWAAIHRHPLDGARLAAPLAPWLGPWSRAIAEHHERVDGTGYPRGLKGDQISEAARIVAVADAFEVMTAARAYKRPMSAALACEELTRHAGSQFDERVVRAFLNVSFTRLRWLTGPVAWVAQLPILGWLPRVLAGTTAVGAQAAGFAGVAALAGASAVATPAGAASNPAPPVTQMAPPAAPNDLSPSLVHHGSSGSTSTPASTGTSAASGQSPSSPAAATGAKTSTSGAAHGNGSTASTSGSGGAGGNGSGSAGTNSKGNGTTHVTLPAQVTSTTVATSSPRGHSSGVHLGPS